MNVMCDWEIKYTGKRYGEEQPVSVCTVKGCSCLRDGRMVLSVDCSASCVSNHEGTDG